MTEISTDFERLEKIGGMGFEESIANRIGGILIIDQILVFVKKSVRERYFTRW